MYHVHTHAHGYTNRRNLPHAHARNTARTDPKTRIHAHECTGACKYTRTNSRTPMHARTYAHARTHTCTLSHTRAHACARSLAPTRALPHTPWHALTRHGTPSHAMVNPHTWHTLTCHHTPAAIDVWLKPTLRPETPACHAFVHTCMRCGAMWCCAEPGSAVQYHARRCSAVRCGTIRRATARRGAVEYRESSEWKWLVSGDTITPVYTCAKLVE